jgi:hypothetical protein
MIRIAISAEAFDAIARTLPLGSVGYENKTNERGERPVWLEEVWVNRLGAMRGPGGRPFGILRIAKGWGATRAESGEVRRP